MVIEEVDHLDPGPVGEVPVDEIRLPGLVGLAGLEASPRGPGAFAGAAVRAFVLGVDCFPTAGAVACDEDVDPLSGDFELCGDVLGGAARFHDTGDDEAVLVRGFLGHGRSLLGQVVRTDVSVPGLTTRPVGGE